MTSICVEVSAWLVACYVFISLLEYLIHKQLMHTKRFSPWAYANVPWLPETFEGHAIRHHVKWYRQFNSEPDEVGREDNIQFGWQTTLALVIGTLPFWLSVFFVSRMGGLFLLITPIVHNLVHNYLHHEMHVPRCGILQNNLLYRALARHHFLHYRHVNRNYNLSFPLFDFVLGTNAQPAWREVREMVRLGLLRGRTLRVQGSQLGSRAQQRSLTIHKQQYKMFKRAGGSCYIEDKDTGKQTRLNTKDKGEAITLFAAKNHAASQPVLDVAMAKVSKLY